MQIYTDIMLALLGEKLLLLHANKKGADQTAHLQSDQCLCSSLSGNLHNLLLARYQYTS